jgi:ornithine cyclodeaminase
VVTFISESESTRLISHESAFEAVRKALIAAASAEAKVFPAVIAHASDRQNTFSLKPGSTPELTGFKVGSFWPDNPAKGRPRHSSTIFLIDEDSGRIGALVEASVVNAYRTAAADAVAAEALARPESETLAVFGAGNQALFECCALARILPLKRLHIVARNRDKANAFATNLLSRDLKLDIRVSMAEEACRQADIIVTATPSRVPLFDPEWVRPGTHIAGMGSDARGKQELPSELFERAKLFCDLPEQSIQIGEFQHVRERIERGELVLNAIGAVLEGRCSGRIARDDITIFDSSGIALQDLYIGQFLLSMSEVAQNH